MPMSAEQRAAFERRAVEFQRKSRREYIELEAMREKGYTYLIAQNQRWHAYHSADARNHLFMLIGEKP